MRFFKVINWNIIMCIVRSWAKQRQFRETDEIAADVSQPELTESGKNSMKYIFSLQTFPTAIGNSFFQSSRSSQKYLWRGSFLVKLHTEACNFTKKNSFTGIFQTFCLVLNHLILLFLISQTTLSRTLFYDCFWAIV